MTTPRFVKQAIVVPQESMNVGTRLPERVAFFNEDGTPVEFGGDASTPTGADVHLTGYTSGSAGNVAAGDSVNGAIAKLEARIAALETPAG